MSALSYPVSTDPSRSSVEISYEPPDLAASTLSTSSDEDVSSPAPNDSEIWDAVDSLYARRTNMKSAGPYSKEVSAPMFFDFDEGTFGADPSTNRVPLHFPRPPGDEMEIPHFPPLITNALLFPLGKDKSTPRTSEPISQGIRQKEESEAMGHISAERFQYLLDSPIGLVRFRDWVDSEGYSGSQSLLRYYQDAHAHASLLGELSSVTDAMDGVYFGPQSGSSAWAQRLLASRPSDCLYALASASIGMQSAQNEAFDKLYAAEFKRFIAGKITAHARFCLEHFADWHDRGDLGEVMCLVDPHLPDQPLVMVSDGFCRLTEYPRETLIGRNCRFLQGPATDPQAVHLLREAVRTGREHCTMLMNYTRTGKAFWNLFNMIPLRNPEGGVDYFLGAQVDCSRALTSPATFQALTGLAATDEERDGAVVDKFSFSQELVDSTDNHPNHPTLLRRIAAPASEKDRAAFKAPRYFRTDANRHYKSTTVDSLNDAPAFSGILPEPIPIPQDLPNPVRDHMTAFSSAFSKIIVFNARDRRILYVTAPLLAALGYPIRSNAQRLAPRILNKDICDLIIDRSTAEANAVKGIIRKVVTDRASHSLFVQLQHNDVKRMSSISEDDSREEFEGEQEPVRSLLHLTPMKDIQHAATMYVVVVG